MARIELSGCYTALITPLTADGASVDVARFREQIAAQVAGGVSGIVPCGTTGESPTLSEGEWDRVVATAVESGSQAGLTVIAGTGSNCTAHAVELQRRAADLGAHVGLSVNPYYNKPTQEGLYRHFSAVADAADLPVLLYNIPGRTGVALQIETIARLATHPNVVAVKDATGSIDSASEVVRQTELTVLSGDDSLTLPFASVGGRGVVSVISNLLPARVQALCDAFNNGTWDRAREAHFGLLPLARGLLSLSTNPIPVKTAMRILGRDSGALRLPLCAPDEAVTTSIETLLRESGHFDL